MKKFSLIYKLSFLPYLAYEVFCFFNDYTDKYQHSLETLVSIFIFLEIPAFIYQLLYIFKLGRKDNVSAVKSIGRFFLYLLLSKSISVIITYIGIYFNGYVEYGFLSDEPLKYYGAEALNKYSISQFCPIQFLVFTVLYGIGYFYIGLLHRKWKEHIAEQLEQLENDNETDG